MNLLVTIVGCIFILGIVSGLIRGSLKVIVSILTSLLIIVGACTLTPYAASVIEKYTPLGDMVRTKVEKNIVENAEKNYKQEIEEAALTYDAVERVFDAAGIEDADLEEFGISIADIVCGNVSMTELNEYGISSNLLAGLYKAAEGKSVKFSVDEWLEDLSTSKQYAAIEELDMVPAFKSVLNEHNKKAVYEKIGAENFLDYVGLYSAKIMISLAAFFLVLLILGIVVRAIIFALDIVTGLPGRGIFNRVLGGVFGIADVVILLWILCVAVNIFYSYELGQKVFDMIMQEPYLKLLYDLNPVWDYITKIL